MTLDFVRSQPSTVIPPFLDCVCSIRVIWGYNQRSGHPGCFMLRLPVAPFLVLSLFIPVVCYCQSVKPDSNPPQSTATAGDSTAPPVAPKIPEHSAHMSKQTRLQIIRDFETQVVYSRTTFPMGSRGLVLKNGATTPNGQALQQMLALWGPSIRPGDPAQISFVRIRDNYIHFDLNGGPIHRKKWYEHIEVSGTGGAPVPVTQNQATDNPHGSYLDLYFDKYVPELSAAQVRALLYPVLDFAARNKEQAYLDTVPPKVKEAILAHHVLVGMNTEMVVHAMGRPPKKVREKDGETEYEEWIYGEPPQDVDFVRIVGDEVVRVETMKVGGQKVVRTEKEIILDKQDKDTEAKDQDRPANAPTLRRPGEAAEDVPKPIPSDGASPIPVATPPTVPAPPGNPGPGSIVASN